MKTNSPLALLIVGMLVIMLPARRNYYKPVSNVNDYDEKVENIFSVRMLEEENVEFPIIHGLLIPLMETSFCKEGTLCSYDWENVMPGLGNWSPHNHSGMKLALSRKTTAVCTVGQFIRKKEKEGFVLNEKYAYLRNDPHAVYKSDRDHARDIYLWQHHTMRKYHTDTGKEIVTVYDYFNLLKKYSYNEDSQKYDQTLRMLYNQFLSGYFVKRYGPYYKQRMGMEITLSL